VPKCLTNYGLEHPTRYHRTCAAEVSQLGMKHLRGRCSFIPSHKSSERLVLGKYSMEKIMGKGTDSRYVNTTDRHDESFRGHQLVAA
jgi:hypothetical protein